VGEVDRRSEAPPTPGVSARVDERAAFVHPAANPESVGHRVRSSIWRLADRSETGCRLVAPANEAPTHLGELLAIRDGEAWVLGVVRRMQRSQAEEVTVGVEIVARKLVRVSMRTWSATAADVARRRSSRSSACTSPPTATIASRHSAVWWAPTTSSRTAR